MRTLFVILCVALSALPAAAQSRIGNAWSDVKNGLRDVAFVWTSPFRLGRDDLGALGLVAGVTGAAFALDHDVQSWLGEHRSSLPVKAVGPFREGRPGEELGDIWLLIRGSGVLWVAGLAVQSETLRDVAVGCASAGVAQTFARGVVLYNLVQRTRPVWTTDPFEFDVPGSKVWEKRSFISGHAANAMTCVAFLNERFELGLVEPVLYAAALGVGAGRIVDEAHWSSDTALGLLFGYAVGRAVAQRQKKRANEHFPAVEPTSGFMIENFPDGRTALGWRVRF